MNHERVEKAVAAFQGGMACSQAILSTYGPLFGLGQEDALRIARGFGGGMARLSETCGAVTGAFMVLGLQYEGAGKEAKEATYSLMQKYADRFKSQQGSLNCTQLLGCDLNTLDGQNRFREQGMMQTHCIPYVRMSAELLEELLKEE